jgi:ACS family hexuronate transporter-like MFS transporter
MPSDSSSTPSTAVGRYRWRICAVLFLATTINYVDRNVLSFTMLDPAFRHDMLGTAGVGPLSDTEVARFKELMGYVDAAFKFAYALGFLLAGYLIDRLGTRRGFSIGIGVWSAAGVAHGVVGSVAGLSVTRFLLGLGEAANFPSAIKTVAEWFPKRERSFATGLFNAGANVGIILTALGVPLIVSALGWRASFILTGALGSLVLFAWLQMYRRPEEHPGLSPAELAHIRQDGVSAGEAPVKWRQLLPFRATWAFALAKFLTDAVWWFYLTWLPSFFNDHAAFATRLDLKQVGVPFLVIYIVSDLGSVFFGWLATRFIGLGWSVNRARKTTMLICALAVVPIVQAATTDSITLAIAIIALATAAHQGWSANLFTTVSDMFPRRAVGSVVGIGGMMGALGGALLGAGAGWIIGHVGYIPLFAFAALAYLAALGVMQLLAPQLQPVELPDSV